MQAGERRLADRFGGRCRLTLFRRQTMTPAKPTAQNTPPPETGGNDPLLEAQSENRQLKNTIDALREALEGMRYENEEAFQNARAESADEIKQLRETAAALRDEMENIRYAKEEAVQNALSESTDEIGQLKATAQALRDELNRLMIAHEKKMHNLERDRHDETRQLKKTIQVLRGKLDGVTNKKPGRKK